MPEQVAHFRGTVDFQDRTITILFSFHCHQLWVADFLGELPFYLLAPIDTGIAGWNSQTAP